MPKKSPLMPISEIAKRCGVATSTLRFYEQRGLIRSYRTAGNQRRFHPSMIRRISVIKVAQSLGLTLEDISGALKSLPDERTPNKSDWEKLSSRWGKMLDERINNLQRLRGNLSNCIGCGCLSMKNCKLVNPDDQIASHGAGPRFLLEDDGSQAN